MTQVRFVECASMQEKRTVLRGELAAMTAGAAGAVDVAAESLEAPEPASGVLQGVTRNGLWGEVLQGSVVESSAKLEDVVVRACGKLVLVALNGNRNLPAPKAKAKAAAKAAGRVLRRAGAPAAPAGKWCWSNLNTLVWIR